MPVINILVNIIGSKSNYSFVGFCQLNFTSTGYIFYSILRSINYLVAPIALLISYFFILHHLLQHRLCFTDDSTSLCSTIKLIILKHRDFLLQPLVFTLCIMPYFIFGHLMTCSKADIHVVGKIRTISVLLSDSALTMTFFTSVSPSKVYMQEFWNTSYFGRFLLHIKDRSCAGMPKKLSVPSISSDVSVAII
jgi:hypothetical protein